MHCSNWNVRRRTNAFYEYLSFYKCQLESITTTLQRSPYNTTTTLTPPLQRSSSHSISIVTLVILVTIVPTSRGVSSPAPLILCLMNIIPRVGQTSISITLIPLRLAFLFNLKSNTHDIVTANHHDQICFSFLF